MPAALTVLWSLLITGALHSTAPLAAQPLTPRPAHESPPATQVTGNAQAQLESSQPGQSSARTQPDLAPTPSAGTAELITRLGSDDPDVVIRALMALGLKRDLSAFVPVLRLLETRSDPDIQAAAMATLEKLNYSVPFLVSVLEDPNQPSVAQAYAAFMLGRMQAREAIPALVTALNSPQATVREHAINALGAMHDMKAWKPLVVAAHKDPSPALRAKAEATAEKLAASSSQTSQLDVETLNMQLQATDVMQRRAAAKALSSAGNYWSVPLLIDALKDPDDDVRRLAARALGDLQDKRAVAPLMAFLPNASGRTLQTAIVALAVLKDPTAVPALIPYLEHPDPDVRRLTARGLGQLDDLSAGPALRKVLADPVPENRLEAAEAVGKLGDTGAVPLLATMARKDVETNRYAAIRALGAIGDPTAVAALIDLLRVKDTITVVTTINALRTAGSMTAVPVLETMAKKHREQWVREEALRAAIEIRGRARLNETTSPRGTK